MSELFLALQLALQNPQYSDLPTTSVVVAAPATHTWPSIYHHVSQPFSGGHSGTDFDSHANTPVIAAASGVVAKISTDGPYGNMIAIVHPQFAEPTITRYAHLNTMLVNVGDVVALGEQIGTVGTSGRATGPHVHFEVWENGAPIDPISWL